MPELNILSERNESATIQNTMSFTLSKEHLMKKGWKWVEDSWQNRARDLGRFKISWLANPLILASQSFYMKGST